jgi:hypothetical protein
MQASQWRVELPGVAPADLARAVAEVLALEAAPVERLTKDGRRTIDVRPAVLVAECQAGERAILDLVVRQVTPTVRPDDVLTALRTFAGLALAAPPVAVRLAQGPLDGNGTVSDPLASDRATAGTTP